MRLRFLPILAVAISLVACGGQDDPGNGIDFQGSELRATEFGEVLASGQGVTVTGRDIRNELEILPAQQRRAVAGDEAAFRNLVSEIYFRRRMTLVAEELGYADDELVQAQLRRAEERLFMDLVPRRYMSDLDIPDLSDKVREEYESNLENYTPEPELRVAHILLRAPSEEARKERRPEAEELLARLRGGESFAELARKYGEDGTREFGGDLGFFGAGRMVPEFEEAAFALEHIGDLDLVETRHGLHLIRLLDREGGEPTPFAEVESWIKDKLLREYQQQATVEWLRSVASPDQATVDEQAVITLFAEMRDQGLPDTTLDSGAQGSGSGDLLEDAAVETEALPEAVDGTPAARP